MISCMYATKISDSSHKKAETLGKLLLKPVIT